MVPIRVYKNRKVNIIEIFLHINRCYILIRQEKYALAKAKLSAHTCAFCFANMHRPREINLVVY